MTDALRLLLLITLAGAVVTFAAGMASWWMDERRRLSRLMRKVLGGTPDALILSPGRNSAIGFRLESDRLAAMREGGARTVLYTLDALDGAELIVDDEVVARVSRHDGRKSLDNLRHGGQSVSLRLIFANALNPEFVLDLWTLDDANRRNERGPGAAIEEARTWLARIDALLRRPPRTAAVRAKPRTEPDFDEETSLD